MLKKALMFFLFVTFLSVSCFAKDLKIGVYLSVTGPVAAWGKLEWEGIKTAHTVKSYVDKRKVILRLEDAASRPEVAINAVEKLISQGIKFTIGPVTTTNALAALPILEKEHVVDVIPTANGMGLVKGRHFATRVCFNNVLQAKVMADYIIGIHKKGVVIEDISQDYAVDLAKRFIDDFKHLNGRIAKVFPVEFSQTDFTAIITKIKQLNPEFIYFSGYYNTLALFLKQLRDFGIDTPVFAGSAASSYALIKIAGKSAEGLIFTDDFDPLIPQNKLAKNFIEEFKRRYKRLPDSPEALAADAYMLLIYGLEKEGENPKKVANLLRNTTFYGITGKIIIKDGEAIRTVVLRKVKDGKFMPVAIYQP